MLPAIGNIFNSIFKPKHKDIENISIDESEFLKIKEQIFKTDIFFITGPAGTGKSTLIRWLKNNVANCIAVAPTGIAAKNINSRTIHSLFGLPLQPLNPDRFSPDKCRPATSVLQNINLLIIDEVSMVHPDKIDAIDKILRYVRRSDRPFGSCPTLLVGDLFQLPPVVKTQEQKKFYSCVYDTEWCFSARIFQNNSYNFGKLALNRNYRQANITFFNHLNNIRIGENLFEALDYVNANCNKSKNNHQIQLVATINERDSKNLEELNKINSKEYMFEAINHNYINEPNSNDWTYDLPAPYVLNLKVGAQILFLKNNLPNWVNGSLGIVTNIKKNVITAHVLDTKLDVEIQRVRWDKEKEFYNKETKQIETEVVGYYEQFPICLGWAITIHKSQGMTIPALRISPENIFCTGQLYVALSRCPNVTNISLETELTLSKILIDEKIKQFYQSMQLL